MSDETPNICAVTGNPCGTDTWGNACCPCADCRQWILRTLNKVGAMREEAWADLSEARTRLKAAEGLLGRCPEVMREWTVYSVWRPLHDDIEAFLATARAATPAEEQLEPTRVAVAEDVKKTCPACRSAILPDGKCVNCRGGTGKGTAP